MKYGFKKLNKVLKLLPAWFLLIYIIISVQGALPSQYKHTRGMLMDFDYLVSQLYVQHCTFVEIGEGICSLFVELPLDVGSKKPLKRQMYFGNCVCAEFRSWQLCSRPLNAQRPNDCAFDEASACPSSSARVHRRLCDVTGMSQWNPQCNCSVPVAGMQQDPMCGFRTCFANPMPVSICTPRTVCGTSKCDISLHGSLYSIKCDKKCKDHQPFCERMGPATSEKRTVLSQWTEWKPISCEEKSNIQQYEAECLDPNNNPAFDCLGPGLLCCGKEEVDCICEVKHEDGHMKVFRYTITFSRSKELDHHSSVRVRSVAFKTPAKVWNRFLDMSLKEDNAESLFSNHAVKSKRRKNQQNLAPKLNSVNEPHLTTSNATNSSGSIFQQISNLVNNTENIKKSNETLIHTENKMVQVEPQDSLMITEKNVTRPLVENIQGNNTGNLINSNAIERNISDSMINSNAIQKNTTNSLRNSNIISINAPLQEINQTIKEHESTLRNKSTSNINKEIKNSALHLQSNAMKKDKIDYHFTPLPNVDAEISNEPMQNITHGQMNKPSVQEVSQTATLINKTAIEHESGENVKETKGKSDEQGSKKIKNNEKHSQQINKNSLKNEKVQNDKADVTYKTAEKNSKPLKNDKASNTIHSKEKQQTPIQETKAEPKHIRKNRIQKLTNVPRAVDAANISFPLQLDIPKEDSKYRSDDGGKTTNKIDSAIQVSTRGSQVDITQKTTPKQVAGSNRPNKVTSNSDIASEVENVPQTEPDKNSAKEDMNTGNKNKEGKFDETLLKIINGSDRSEPNQTKSDLSKNEGTKKLTTPNALFFSDIENLLPNVTPTSEVNVTPSHTTSAIRNEIKLSITTTKPLESVEKKLFKAKEALGDQQDPIQESTNLNPSLPSESSNSKAKETFYDEPEPVLKDLDKDSVDDNMADALNNVIGLKQPQEKVTLTEDKEEKSKLQEKPDGEKRKVKSDLNSENNNTNKGGLAQNNARFVHGKLKRKMSHV